MNLVAGHDGVVAEWAQTKFTGLNFYAMHSAFGVENEGHLIGAAIFSDYYPGGNVELTYYGPGTLTRRLFGAIAYHAFITLGVSRVTARTRCRNKEVIGLLQRLGFKHEAVVKRYFGPREMEDGATVFYYPVEKAGKWLRKAN